MKSLCLTAIHAGIMPVHQERLAYIDSCDFNRYFDKAVELDLISGDVDRDAIIFALKQYYAVAMLDPANGHAVSDVVDPLWHAHMLFSEEYLSHQQQSYAVALGYAKEAEGTNLSNHEAINLTNQTRGLTDAVIEASSKRGYQCPTSVNNYGFDAELCSLNDIRDLAVLTAFRANVEADTGNKEQAIKTAVSVVQFGDLVGNTEQPTLIEHLVGITVMNIGLESLERTLNTSATTSNQTIRSAISDLEQSKINDNIFADSLRREYMGLKDTSKSFEQFSNYFYQHNKTVNQRAEIFRMGVAISSQGCDADTTQEQQKIDELVEEMRLSPTKWPIISPNFIGKVINSVVVASLSTASEEGCEVNELNKRVQDLLQSNITTEPEPEIVDAG